MPLSVPLTWSAVKQLPRAKFHEDRPGKEILWNDDLQAFMSANHIYTALLPQLCTASAHFMYMIGLLKKKEETSLLVKEDFGVCRMQALT